MRETDNEKQGIDVFKGDKECKTFAKQIRYSQDDPVDPNVICDENAAEGGIGCDTGIGPD